MRASTLALVIVAILALLLAPPAVRAASGVVELTDDNFDENVLDGEWLVEL
jgi:type II secretory pathway pseudopilin PulG